MEQNIKVSVICCAYNQEKYIRDAIESFLMQETDFSYEILISDDASVDHTAEIIREYEQRYPDLIRPVYFEENQYSRGNYPGTTLKKLARGELIAICEGDDYWLSKDKLQKQVDALKAHPECDMCAHSANMVNPATKDVIGTISPRQDDGILTMDDVIVGGGNYLASNSIMYRRTLIDDPADFAQLSVYDYCFQMHGALRGGIWYIAEELSAYRRGADQSWTLHMMKHPELMIHHIEEMLSLLDAVDQETSGQYAQSISYAKLKYTFQLDSLKRKKSVLFDRKYRSLRKEMSAKKKLILVLKVYAPFVITLFQKLKGYH